jgi:cation diffusion facilitator CzcD-associated flavoprotein CzcO
MPESRQPRSPRYVIIGAGPAGLQLSYFLQGGLLPNVARAAM